MICGRAFPLIRTASEVLAAARFEERFGVLKELMLALDVVPLSGQDDVPRQDAAHPARRGAPTRVAHRGRDLVSLSNAMTELEHEAGRFAPTPGLFNRHVEIAIGALRRTISRPGVSRAARASQETI